jgi:hypothetical protein
MKIGIIFLKNTIILLGCTVNKTQKYIIIIKFFPYWNSYNCYWLPAVSIISQYILI